MYIPKHFEEPSIEVLHELIRARPLSTVVTLTSGGLDANHSASGDAASLEMAALVESAKNAR